jgi:hypothetical protein
MHRHTTLDELLARLGNQEYVDPSYRPDGSGTDGRTVAAHVIIDGVLFSVHADTRVARLRELRDHLARGHAPRYRATKSGLGISDGRIDHLYLYATR